MNKAFFENNIKELECIYCVDYQACARSAEPLCRSGLEIASKETIDKLYAENCETQAKLAEIYRLLNVGFGSNAQEEAVRKLERFSRKFKE